MLIRDLLLEKGGSVETIASDRTIHNAIGQLNRHRIGALVVTGEQGEIVGILTERDILEVCGGHCGNLENPPGSSLSCPQVADAMTRDVVIGVPSDDLNYAMGIMVKNRIRHLPVMEDGKLAGIISIGDLVNAHIQEKVIENRTLREYLNGG